MGETLMKNYHSKDKWLVAVKDHGHEVTTWGNGSCNAVDPTDGATFGSWHAKFDCADGIRPNGRIRSK